MQPKTFIMIGRSGCGKGTQADLLLEYLKEKNGMEGYHLESGKRFREFIKSESYTAGLTREIVNSGGLPPEFLAIWLWTTTLVENVKPDTNLIIDGAPRKRFEAEVMALALKFYKREDATIILINVGEDAARERLMARARGDDQVAGINKRLGWYQTDVIPVIDFFKNESDFTFIEINGEQAVEKVQSDIRIALGI